MLSNKRILTEYSGLALMFLIILFYMLNMPYIFIMLSVLWYFMYGFVGLAFTLRNSKPALANMFILLTIPIFLLPFRKSFYYWIKSVIRSKTDLAAAFKYAQKVNISALATDNNRSMFYSYLACLYMDKGNKEYGIELLQKAKTIPHKAQVDEVLNILIDKVHEDKGS